MAEQSAVVHVPVARLDTFFDESRTAFPPHTGRMVDEGFADYLEAAAREHRTAVRLELEFRSSAAPERPEVEEGVRTGLHRYFASEAERARLDERVNHTEGRGSIRYAAPIILAAGVVALIVYVIVGVMPPDSLLVAFLVAFAYLVFITFVWVLLWDPVEQIYFIGYQKRTRTSALDKLSKATVRFSYNVQPPGTS